MIRVWEELSRLKCKGAELRFLAALVIGIQLEFNSMNVLTSLKGRLLWGAGGPSEFISRV
jgi:hypothetical protein